MLDRYENHVKKVLADVYRLELRKIPEADLPRPDFEVFDQDRQIAVLEVKAIESTAEEVTADSYSDEGLIPGSTRPDNCTRRVAKKVHEAVRQFERVSFPRILVLLNVRSEADEYDLVEVLQGHLTFEDGKRLTSMPLPVRQRSADDKARIDLYLWVDIEGGTPSVVPATVVGKELESAHFLPASER
jgi:hypothetical protein